jgi:hypothetical protein
MPKAFDFNYGFDIMEVYENKIRTILEVKRIQTNWHKKMP